EENIGTRDIDSTPAAMTMSYTPAMTPWAAKWTACCEEPHCRSTDVAGTDSGKPAASTPCRAMLNACSPACETQPVMTSSICAGSMPVRSTSALRTSPSRSAGCQPESAPPGLPLPIGVRMASTMTASRIKTPRCRPVRGLVVPASDGLLGVRSVVQQTLTVGGARGCGQGRRSLPGPDLAHEAPGGREGCRGGSDLHGVAHEEGHDSHGDRRDQSHPGDGHEPHDAARVDDQVAHRHEQCGLRHAAVAARAGPPPHEQRRDEEAGEVAERRPTGDREPGDAERPDREVGRHPRGAAQGAQGGGAEQDDEGL